MAKKPNVKALLMEKGEKFALIGAAVLMALFAALGIAEMSGGFSPSTFEQEVLATAQKVNSTVSGSVTPGAVPELGPEYIGTPPTQPIVTKWANNLFFDPIAPPDKRRVNPIVLPVTEVQADYIPAKIIAYDLKLEADGTLIGVITQAGKKDEKITAEDARRDSTQFNNRFNALNMRGGGMRPPPQPRGGEEGAPVGKKGPVLPQGAPIEEGMRQFVEYVPNDPEKLAGKRYALTIYPQRMVVVQAAFPYRAQIEEIQKALRLESPLDVFTVYAPEEVPLFRGVLIQRQVMAPDGTIEQPWSDVDLVSLYRSTIFPRKYGSKPDEASTNYVLLHKGHGLTLPLPTLLSGKYPDLKLQTIKDTIAKQTALRKPPPQPKAPSQFNSEGDVFEDNNSAGGAVGQPNVGGEGLMLPKVGGGREGEKGGEELSTENRIAAIPEHILIRMIDNDIQPGRLYQYRLKVLMQNPNWIGPKDPKRGTYPAKFKQELVSRPSDAEVMLLGANQQNEAVVRARFGLDGDDLRKNLNSETPWTELKGNVSVPREEYWYAADPPLDNRGNPQPQLRPGQGLLQVQRWLPTASVDRFKEPVADWVVADVLATRGTYLGGKQLVNLPLWDSRFNRYTLRQAPPEKGKSRYGVSVDPTRPGPQYIVADVEGGARENRPMTRQSTFREDTAAEVLLVDENGTPRVYSSYADRTDPGRAERETAWKAWIEQTEKATAGLLPNDPMQKKKDGFD